MPFIDEGPNVFQRHPRAIRARATYTGGFSQKPERVTEHGTSAGALEAAPKWFTNFENKSNPLACLNLRAIRTFAGNGFA